METKAILRGVRLSDQKGRLIADQIRGRPVDQALNILAFSPKKGAGIVKKVLDARGGVQKIKAVQSERISGQVSFAQGMDGTFVVELKRPLKMRAEITVQGQKIIRVYDGKSSGWMVNPFVENKGVEPLSPEELKNISDESDFDGPLVDYKAKGNQIELANYN